MSLRWAPNRASPCSRSGCRRTLEARWVADLVTGPRVGGACAPRVQLVGGNISRAPMLFVDVTVSGAAKPRHLLRRSGARPGDELYVSGTVGAAAAGLAWLQSEIGRAGSPSRPRRKALIRTLLIPETARSENGPCHRQSRRPSPAIGARRRAWPSASRLAATRRRRPAWTPATAWPTRCASLPGPAASACASTRPPCRWTLP